MTTGGYGYEPYTGQPYAGPIMGVTPAGLGPRAVARFIDWIIAGIVGGIVFWALEHASGLPGWASVIPGAGFGFLYFVAFEVLAGATPGKKLLGLHVNGSGGAPRPSLADSAKRNAYMLLNLIPWVGGLLWFCAAIAIAVTVGASPTKQGWHDNFADGTQVVKG
ncbi:RDD family protein [Nocardia sp. CDC153]|uniref:RDD family protein n=1 Tax=Nocardia sp. CDC153 TaxID=3112167 RepID=UPI002DB665C2|nr:RDD family protein [Nocardia sp. CDC153]MEC3956619.1 RDD family protein [Nocardia sp. CDC153]